MGVKKRLAELRRTNPAEADKAEKDIAAFRTAEIAKSGKQHAAAAATGIHRTSAEILASKREMQKELRAASGIGPAAAAAANIEARTSAEILAGKRKIQAELRNEMNIGTKAAGEGT